jgi:hypothetical protein
MIQQELAANPAMTQVGFRHSATYGVLGHLPVSEFLLGSRKASC